jgi:hypothetical protein
MSSEKKTSSNSSTFKLPVVLQNPTTDTIEFTKSDYLSETWFVFMGKHRFTDTVIINDHEIIHENYRADFVDENHIWDSMNPPSEGFQIFADYKTTVYEKDDYFEKGYYCFPVYVANETSRTKFFIAKDNYAFGIQEAADSSFYDIWRPIEGKGFDFCGNGSFGLKVHPGEFIMLLVPKYEGNEKGLMRVRLQIGESIYLSNSFNGMFNRKQFDPKKGTLFYDVVKRNDPTGIQRVFYGSVPKSCRD